MSRVTQLPLEDLAARIEAELIVWVRLGAAEVGGEWQLQLLEITAGIAPPSWRPVRWAYRQAFFLAFRRKGPTVARWVRRRRIAVRPLNVRIEQLTDSVWWERRASHATGIYEPLPWPSEEWHVANAPPTRPSFTDELVAETAPSFVSFQTAAESLLGVEHAPGSDVYRNDFIFRRQDDSGRILSVHISAAEVRIRVEGSRLRGAVVELAGDQPGPTQRLARNGQRQVSFALPGGLPSGSWVVLRSGDDWLDRRFLTWPYARGQEPGVEIQLEPLTRIEVLVAGGEGPTTEFKERLPGEDDSSKRQVMKTVAAFANGEGGSILFGISNDGGIVGLERVMASQKGKDRLTHLIKDWVSPLVEFSIESLPVANRPDRRVLILSVEPGDEPPYGAGTRPTNMIYYVRRGGTSFAIGAKELRALARSRPPAGQPRSTFPPLRS